MSDFDILLGVDMSNAENEIKKSIESIGNTYKLKLDLIIGNKDAVFKQIGDIQKLFGKLGNLDLNFGVNDAKKVSSIKEDLERMSHIDISDVGEDLSKSLDKASQKLKAVRDEYGRLMKVVEKEQNNTLTSVETSGDKFLSKRQTKKSGINGNIIDEKTPEPPTFTRNFDALDSYVSKAMNKINSMKNVTKSNLNEVANLTERLTKLNLMMANGDKGFHDEVKAINQLIEHYDKLEREMMELNKTREAQAREAIKWANKLAEVEQRNYANPASKKKMGRLIGELDAGDFKNLDALQSKLQQIQNQFAKIQGQEKRIAFGRKVVSEYDKIDKKVNSGKLDNKYTSEVDSANLNKAVSGVKTAENMLQLENALKKVNNTYDDMLKKQADAIQKEKMLVKEAEDLARLRKHLSDTENERARLDHDKKEREHEVKQRTGLVSDKYDDVSRQKGKMVDSGFIDAKDFDKIENRLRELGRLAQNEYVDKLDVQKELNAIDKEMMKISSRYEDMDSKQRKIRTSTHDWGKEIDKIKAKGFVEDNEFEGIRKSMKALSVDSKTYEQDLKRIETQMNRMNTLSDKRSDRKESLDINKGRNNKKAEDMRGVVPDSIIDDFKGMNNMLDFTSSKRDIALIEDEMRKISQLNKEIAAAGKDQERIEKAIAKHKSSAIKSADKYKETIDDLVKATKKQIDDDDRLNRIKLDSAKLQREINDLKQRENHLTDEEKNTLDQKKVTLARLAEEQRQGTERVQKMEQQSASLQQDINRLKERGLQLSYDEQRAIQQQIKALKQLAREQRESDLGGNSRDRQHQSLIDKFNSVSYRATRGFGENSTEAKQLKDTIQDIERMINGLSGKVGKEFDQSTREIQEAMNRLNTTSRNLRDEDQRRRSSTSGQIVNALQKVPIWAAAMGIVYGTIEQIRQGFQSVLDIDAAMINLAKVSEASRVQLKEFQSTASEMGRDLGVVAKDVIEATTAFQRLGYTLEQSTSLGKNSILYANVGDMDVTTASDNLTGVIQGFGVEVDEAGNNVRKIVDMFNEVSNNFAITASGIGESMKRNSAVMYEAGNTMEQAVALSASANAIIQNPTKVGNGLKTIAMRLRGVTEEGDAVDELGSKLQVTFDRINKQFNLMGDEALQTLESDGQTFKSTYEIFEKVATVWDKLSDMERANLVEKMGGKEQGNIVAAIIQNWDDAEEAANTASNSAGSAAQEFSAYMEGFEYKIGQLKNALEEFWTSVIDSDVVKMLIDALTSIIDTLTTLTNTFGASHLVTIIGGLFAVFASKNLRDAVTTVSSLSGAFKGLGGWITRIGGLLGRLIPYVGVLLAIGTAANVVVGWITADAKARRERLEVLDEEIKRLNQFQESYNGIFSKDYTLQDFSALQSKGTARSVEEEQKYLQTINQIKSSMPELISHYNEKGEAVIKSTSAIKELIRVNDLLLLQSEKEQLKLNIDETDFDTAQEKIKDVMDAKSQLNASQGVEKMQSVAKDYLQNEIDAIDSSNYQQVLDGFREKVSETFNSLSEDQKNYFSQMELDNLQNIIPATADKDKALSMLDDMIKKNSDSRHQLQSEFDKTKSALQNGSDELVKLIDEGFRVAIKEKGIETNSNTFLFVDEMRKNLVDNLDTLGYDIKGKIEDIPNYIDQAIQQIEGHGISMDDIISPNTENFEKIRDQIKGIRDELAKADPNNPMIAMYDALILKHTQAYNAIKNAPINPFEFTKDVMNPVHSLIGEISDLGSAYRTLKDDQELSLDTTIDLITKHPELIKHMKVEDGQLKLTGASVRELAKIKEQTFKADISQKRQQQAEAIKTAKTQIHNNKLEIISLQEKMKALNLANNAATTTNAPFVQTNTSNSPFGGAILPYNPMQSFVDAAQAEYDAKMKTTRDAVAKGEQDVKDMQASIDAMDKLLQVDFTAGTTPAAKAEKEKKEKAAKELQDAIYVVDKYAKRVAYLNREIEKQQKIQSEYGSHTKTYKDAVNQEIYLTNLKKKAIDDETKSLQAQIKAKNIQKTGLIQVNGNENENKTARAIAAELQQEIDQAQDRLLELGSESDATQTKINELHKLKVQSTLDAFDLNREMMSDDIAYQEYAMELYDSTTQAYRDHANEKLKLLKQEQKFNKDELAFLIKEKETNKNLTNQQINDLNALIRARRTSIYDTAESIQAVETLIANSGLEKYMWQMADESKKYADAISKIQDQIKYDLKEEGEYGKQIDFLKQIVSLRKGERADIMKNITYLEKQLVLYADNKEMVEKITQELENWKGNLKDTENAIKDTNLEIKSVYQTISNQYVELYKEQLKLMQQAEEKHYQNKTKAEQKAHENRMKQIDDELKALQDAYDKQMKLIDRAESARNHEQDSTKLQKEADELKRQIDLLSMDDSYEAKTKKTELVKQLSEKELELAELNHDREVDLRKDNLEDDLDAEKEKLEARKERYQDDYDNLIASLEKEAQKRQEYWEGELNNEKKFAELRKQVMDGNFEEMFKTIDTWKVNVSGKMAELGDQITKNFTYKVQEAVNAMKDLSTMKVGSYTDSTTKNPTNNLDGDLKPTVDIPKNSELTDADKAKAQATKDKAVIMQMKENSLEWHNADDKRKKELLDENQKLGTSIGAVYKNGTWYQKDGKTKLYTFDTGGYTGDWSGDEGRLGVLHKKELVLNKDQTQHILDTAKIMEKFQATVPTSSLMSKVGQVPAPVAPSTSETNEYNIEVNINGNADKKVADTVADQIVNKMKRTRGGRY